MMDQTGQGYSIGVKSRSSVQEDIPLIQRLSKTTMRRLLPNTSKKLRCIGIKKCKKKFSQKSGTA